MKHKILSKSNRKVKQLMRRFDDESDGENGSNDGQNKLMPHQGQQKNMSQKKKEYLLQKQKIKKQKESEKQEKVQQPILKRKISDRTNDSFDVQNDSDNEANDAGSKQVAESGVSAKTTLSSVFSKILQQDVKQSAKQNPIFADFNKPLKKVKQEIRKDRENAIKKRIKILKENRGHVLPQDATDGGLYEKELKIQAAKGIIKILDAVKNYQEAEGIE